MIKFNILYEQIKCLFRAKRMALDAREFPDKRQEIDLKL